MEVYDFKKPLFKFLITVCVAGNKIVFSGKGYFSIAIYFATGFICDLNKMAPDSQVSSECTAEEGTGLEQI